jgi:hypothetical protein
MIFRRFYFNLCCNKGTKYDCEQRYQSITGQCEELIQTNNQLQRTLNDTELRIQQLETNKTQVNDLNLFSIYLGF